MTQGKQISRTEYVVPLETTPKQAPIGTPPPPETEQTLTPAETASCVIKPPERTNETQPLTITILKAEHKPLTTKTNRIGRHTRKTKGKTYSSPRILLGPNMDQYVGARTLVFRARASLVGGGWNLTDQVVLIAVLLP